MQKFLKMFWLCHSAGEKSEALTVGLMVGSVATVILVILVAIIVVLKVKYDRLLAKTKDLESAG